MFVLGRILEGKSPRHTVILLNPPCKGVHVLFSPKIKMVSGHQRIILKKTQLGVGRGKKFC